MKQGSFEWPGGNVLAVCPIVAWETWPDDLGTRESLQNTSRPLLPTRIEIAQWCLKQYEAQHGTR